MSQGKPPSRDWRAHPPMQTAYSREWRGSGSRSNSQFSRVFKLRLLGLGLFGVAALIVAVIVSTNFSSPQTQVLTFGIGAYDQASPRGIIPINPFGKQDVDSFQRLKVRFLSVANSDNALSRVQFQDFWKQGTRSGGLDRRNLIVFCTTHAVMTDEGKVMLFAIDSNPEDESFDKLIPLDELIADLKDSPARHVLLALDVSRLGTNWKLGVLSNDVVEQLVEKYSNENVADSKGDAPANKVAILLAAEPGQLSWPYSDQSGIAQSAFAHFLIEGLLGAADGADELKQTNQRVSLNELVAYTRKHTEEWAKQRFGFKQTIHLVGNKKDFDVCVVAKSVLKDQGQANVKSDDLSKKSTPPDEADGEDKKVDAPQEKENATDLSSEKWDPVRSVELWKTRDDWRDRPDRSGDRTKDEWYIKERRWAPFAWRAFQHNLILAESLRLNGEEGLGAEALRKAGNIFSQMSTKDFERDNDWSFGSDAEPPSKEDLQKAREFLDHLMDGSTPPQQTEYEPKQVHIRTCFVERLRESKTTENWNRLRQISGKLFPENPDFLFLRDFLAAKEDEAEFDDVDELQKLFDIRDRIRKLSWFFPESWPLVKDKVQAAVWSQDAAELWLLNTDARHSETRKWLNKATEELTGAENSANQYSEAIGIWNDLLSELPSIAEWIATRSNNDETFDVAGWRRLAKEWELQEGENRWQRDVNQQIIEPLSGLEQKLLKLFFDAQRLKVTLIEISGQQKLTNQLAVLVKECKDDQVEFWRNFNTSVMNSLETKTPLPSDLRQSIFLLNQPWISLADRDKLHGLQKRIEPELDGSNEPNMSRDALAFSGPAFAELAPEKSFVKQGFWSAATLSLFDDDLHKEKSDLWSSFDEYLEGLKPSEKLSDSKKQSLRDRRVAFGKKIREKWFQGSRETGKERLTLPSLYLLAANLPPHRFSITDGARDTHEPDSQIKNFRLSRYSEWLELFSQVWRSRASHSKESNSYLELANRAVPKTEETSSDSHGNNPRIEKIKPITFSADRLGELSFSVSPNPNQGSTYSIFLSGAKARLIEGTNLVNLEAGVQRELPTDGIFSLKLDETVETPEQLLIVLTNTHERQPTKPVGYPLDFREVILNPPFDSNKWRIQFAKVEANDDVPLESLFLPPRDTFTIRPYLIRPEKDRTTSAQIEIFRFVDSSVQPQPPIPIISLNLELEPGRTRIPINCDLTGAPKDKLDSDKPDSKDDLPKNLAQELVHGLLFKITPDGQKESITRKFEPTFYSAEKFIEPPRPGIENDRLVLELKCQQNVKEKLLPKSFKVKLNVPDWLEEQLTASDLNGDLLTGNKRAYTLFFELPKNWKSLSVAPGLKFTLDVAGLPHAYQWQIQPTGEVTQITGEDPNLEIRLVHPDSDGKTPRRLKPILRNTEQANESLNLAFRINATKLDRIKRGTGDWQLRYSIINSATNVPTGLEQSLSIYSSVERHVQLESITKGIWTVRTHPTDYFVSIPANLIQGKLGRFRVLAEITNSDQPNALVNNSLEFAIDNDRPPVVSLTEINKPSGSRKIDNDLTIEFQATDNESGIQLVEYGFDINKSKMLDGDEVLGSESSATLNQIDPQVSALRLDPATLRKRVTIPKAKLPPLGRDEEGFELIVNAQSGLGKNGTASARITFSKPASPPVAPSAPTKEPTGSLIVRLKNLSKGAKSTVTISGPEQRTSPESEDKEVRFDKLKPGSYKIEVDVRYISSGLKQKGENKSFEVKSNESKSTEIAVSTSK